MRHAADVLFYLTLTSMPRTFSNSAGPVIAIPLAFAFGRQLFGGVPALISFLPWALVVPVDGSDASVVSTIIAGQTITTLGAIAVTVISCGVFTSVAFRQWSRTEF